MVIFDDSFEATINMMIRHDREADILAEKKRQLQRRLRTHGKNRKNKRKVSKSSRRANR